MPIEPITGEPPPRWWERLAVLAVVIAFLATAALALVRAWTWLESIANC